MNSRYVNLFRFFFVCIDLLALNIIHYALTIATDRIPYKGEQKYLLLFLVANMAWLISAYGTSLYINDSVPSFERFARRTMKSFAIYVAVMGLFIFVYHYPYSRLFIMLNFVSFGAILLCSRLVLLAGNFYMTKSNKTIKKIVIVGYNDISKKLAYSFLQKNNFQLDGYFENPKHIKELSILPIIGNIGECVPYAIENNINEIYSTISPEINSSIYDMAQLAEKSLIRFKFVPDFKLYVNRNTHIEYMDEFPILSLRPEPLEDMNNSIKKRFFDIVISTLTIIFILSWLVPLMAILIKLTSKGPVFFVQLRSGKDNRQFRCYKFRSLAVNDDANVKQVTKDDNRITKLGRIMRKTNLDEMPQFFNVLKGDMSVVGPRPHMLQHTENYSKILSEYMIRHFLKPGITGWAQINGCRGEIKNDSQLRKRIKHDIWYMENWSLLLDIKIIFLTIYNTIKGDKNAF